MGAPERLVLHLEGGGAAAAWLEPGRAWLDAGDGILRTASAAAAAELRAAAQQAFRPSLGLRVEPRRVRLGGRLSVAADDVELAEVTLYLVPLRPGGHESHGGVPAGAVPLATVRPRFGRFAVDVRLPAEPGGVLRPGAWSLAVGGREVPVWILPAGEAVPRAVAVRGERVAVWTPEAGLRWAGVLDPEDAPSWVSRRGEGSPVATVTAAFLATWLGVPVREAAPGTLVVGADPALVQVQDGAPLARVNGTAVGLGGVARRDGGRWRVPWDGLGTFLGYEARWLGSATVVFWRGTRDVPAPVARALAREVGPSPSREVPVELPGGRVVAGTLVQGRVLVPLRATLAALGGRVDHLRLPAPGRGDPFWSATSLDPRVTALADAVWRDRRLRVYLAAGEPARLPVRALAQALGLRVDWDAARRTALVRAGDDR